MSLIDTEFSMNFDIVLQHSKINQHNSYYSVEFVIRFDTYLNEHLFYMNKKFIKSLISIPGFKDMIIHNVVSELYLKKQVLEIAIAANQLKYDYEHGYDYYKTIQIEPIGKGFNIVMTIGRKVGLDSIEDVARDFENYKL